MFTTCPYLSIGKPAVRKTWFTEGMLSTVPHRWLFTKFNALLSAENSDAKEILGTDKVTCPSSRQLATWALRAKRNVASFQSTSRLIFAPGNTASFVPPGRDFSMQLQTNFEMHRKTFECTPPH
ncbi:hypothetical protein BaRGS_00007994 [Batillaria attramentaria]|uniref:Uncharacterized protein n=1 Tax=Batillaria attramentaria TaxID=370345 RepID=A0ABD0LML4_9CAEN